MTKMIRQFQSYKTHIPQLNTWKFYNLNEFLLDSFTMALHRKSPSINSTMEPIYPLNKTPYIFAIELNNAKSCKNIDDATIVMEEVWKIKNTLSVYARPFNWHTYENLNVDGNYIIFRNWINGQQDSKINALTIIEKVNLLPEKEDYYKLINQPFWYPNLNNFKSYKNKSTLTQTLDGKNILIE